MADNFWRLNESGEAAFHENGYLAVPGLLNEDETDLLYRIAKADEHLRAETVGRLDAAGDTVQLALSNALHSDMYSAIVQCERVARTMERLLGDEVYHYHHKMTIKAPFTGGAFEWHQDYGYWYNNGCLWPDMGSCLIAVDPNTRENGCLQVIRGSHRMGRIDHGRVADQTGADLERVEHALARMELVYCEMEPGDALFFHCNTLHRSDANRSSNPRWSFISCYNTRHNDPYKTGGHPNYSPMPILPDSAVLTAGDAQLRSMSAR